MKIFKNSLFCALVASRAQACVEGENYACDVVPSAVTFENSWSCRNCFRVRIQLDLAQVPAGTLFNTNEDDKLYIAFNEPLTFLKIGGPAEDVEFVREHEGKFYYWITFEDGYSFGNNQIDVNAEFMATTTVDMDVVSGEVITCPCSAETGGGAEVVIGDCNEELARIDFQDYGIAGWQGQIECAERRRGKMNFCQPVCSDGSHPKESSRRRRGCRVQGKCWYANHLRNSPARISQRSGAGAQPNVWNYSARISDGCACPST